MQHYTELSLPAQTAYAQLADVANGLELSRDVSHLHGSFSQKTVRGLNYWYFSYRDIDGVLRQLYVGPASEAVDAVVARAKAGAQAGAQRTEPLVKAAVALGCAHGVPKHVRAVRRLLEYGFFRAGGVLVGTHAFIAMGNMLGVKWTRGESTTDVDFAHAGKNMSLALPAKVKIDVHEALSSFEAGFIPLVQLGGTGQGGKTGASYKLSGDAEFQIDFLTSQHRGGDAPVKIANLNIALQPLRFMEFSLEQVEQAVLMDRNGVSVVVNIPSPARYAVHKLLVVGERSAAFQTKANKDVQQAAALIDWHLSYRVDDLAQAWADAHARGVGWQRRLSQGLNALTRAHADLALRLVPYLPATVTPKP
jgi:hypothetical protein